MLYGETVPDILSKGFNVGLLCHDLARDYEELGRGAALPDADENVDVRIGDETLVVTAQQPIRSLGRLRLDLD